MSYHLEGRLLEVCNCRVGAPRHPPLGFALLGGAVLIAAGHLL
ncbi:MYXO-CTERM sorting domain-containing protein [Burkholderia ubonensis]|nr:MYXO-CTERM sorting domain-containing protein [Burkholderia ubonensis]